MEQFRRARELDDRGEYVYRRMGAVLLWENKVDEAIAAFQKAAELSNRQPESLAWLAYAYAISGRKQDAVEVRDEILRKGQRQYVSPFYVAMVYAGLGDKENGWIPLIGSMTSGWCT